MSATGWKTIFYLIFRLFFRILLEFGADINARDGVEGSSPIERAAEAGFIEVLLSRKEIKS